MPSYTAGKPAIRPSISPPAMLGLSPIERLCIGNLVGNTLARIERELHSSNIKIPPRKSNPRRRRARNFGPFAAR